MKIISVEEDKKKEWNTFVSDNFPPVGAFLQSFEWGDFKAKLNFPVKRYAVTSDGLWVGCLQLETHSLPFGYKYGYVPRGPVLKKDIWHDAKLTEQIFIEITRYLKQQCPLFVFVRFEPPYKNSFSWYKSKPFNIPSYYIQPRFNQIVSVVQTEEQLKAGMVADVRHDLRAAERLDIKTCVKDSLNEFDDKAFEAMKSDTSKRSGKQIFPNDTYFSFLYSIFKNRSGIEEASPYIRFFIATKEDSPVAIYLAIFFAHTVTYLYGASYSGSKSKRAPAYLHWGAIQEAKKAQFHYYDIGGVDEVLWPGLTFFKKQFGGKTLEYVGVVDFIINPFLYSLYSIFKRCLLATKLLKE